MEQYNNVAKFNFLGINIFYLYTTIDGFSV